MSPSARVAAACPNDDAAAAARRIGLDGGNAVDAAVAAMLVVCVNEPGMVSLAGGAFVTVDPGPGQVPVTVDGYVEMPGRGLPPAAFGQGLREISTEYGGGTHLTIGHGSVATPGALSALEEAHRRFGVLPWSVVVEPAIEVARTGFAMSSAVDYFMSYVREDLFGHDPATRTALHRADGNPVRRGETLRIPDLAEFLERVAKEGASALMAGEAARALTDDMAANGGLITMADLEAYQPLIRAATRVEVGPAARRWHLATNPPPAIGGPVLAALLLVLGESADVAELIRVTRAVLRHRRVELDVAEDRAAAAQALLDDVHAGGQAWRGVAPSTAHVSAVDAAGGACAITASTGYGSGITIPGTGVWLNNCLGEHELNRTGVHSLAPGVRLASNMAPTVGRRDDGAWMAIGSPGADRITTALAQVISAAAVLGLDWEEAVRRPRIHISQPAPGAEQLEYEEDLGLEVLDAAGLLPALRELPRRAHHALSMYFGGVGVAVHEADGRLHAAADPRRGGAVATA